MNEKVAVLRYDSIPLEKAHYTDEGYLVDKPIVTSVGIFEYKNEDGSIRRELRMPEHVFKKESLESYKGKPIIVTHDAGLVNKNNVVDEAVGTILSAGFQDGNDVRAEIIIHDTNELKRCGLKELSLGYSLDLVEEPGEWNGEHYDAIQTNIVINHLALVANARAGEQARLNIDGKDEEIKEGGNSTVKKNAKRKDEGDLAVELAKAVLEETVAPDATGTATADAEGVAPAPEQQEGPEGASAPQPSEELLQSIRDRKDRRDAEEESTPTNLDEANEVIRQQNEDIDALLSMLDKKQEEENPVAEEGNTDSEEGEETVVEENTDGEEEENTDCGDNVNNDEEGEEEKAPTMNADSIDAIVRARASLITLGERFNIDGLDSLPMEAAMKKVISVATPGIRLDSATELKGAFKVAVAVLNSQKDTNYQRQQMYSGTRADSAERCKADEARTRMINSRK